MLHHDTVRNRLLQRLTHADFRLLKPHLQLIPTGLRQTLIAPHEQVAQLFFPEVGYASVTADAKGKRIEVGLIGREGLVGASPVLLADNFTVYREFVLCPGEMLAIDANRFRSAIDNSPTLRTLMLRYLQTRLVQAQQFACANAAYTTPVRLARWMLMCHDRSDGDEIPITHEALSFMLGVRRAGVTHAVHVLEGRHLIKAHRGRITVQDREGLIDLAGGSYGLPEAEYARLIEGV